MINDYLNYDPKIGNLIWITDVSSKARKGSIAGSLDRDGYIIIIM